MRTLRIVFPALMVLGALGSFIVELVDNGFKPTALQWISACGLYLALLMRNVEG